MFDESRESFVQEWHRAVVFAAETTSLERGLAASEACRSRGQFADRACGRRADFKGRRQLSRELMRADSFCSGDVKDAGQFVVERGAQVVRQIAGEDRRCLGNRIEFQWLVVFHA